MTLTKRQMDVLSFVHSYRKKNGFAPTMTEIGASLSMSGPTVFGHLDALERKGAISRTPREARSIEVLCGSLLDEGLENDLADRVRKLEEEIARLKLAMRTR